MKLRTVDYVQNPTHMTTLVG